MSDTIGKWNDAAMAFATDQERSAFAEANRAVVKERFQKLNGERVLDLGCGYGYYTDWFQCIGGHPVGIDGAAAMIAIARERYPECEFDVADITKPLPFPDESFDIVFCNQVLMDTEHAETVFAESRRVLKRGGILYYSIVHPAFYNGSWQADKDTGITGKLISSYLTPAVISNRFWGETPHFHRPLSFYLNAASDAGLLLVRTEEPRVYDGAGRNGDLPLFFFAEYMRP